MLFYITEAKQKKRIDTSGNQDNLAEVKDYVEKTRNKPFKTTYTMAEAKKFLSAKAFNDLTADMSQTVFTESEKTGEPSIRADKEQLDISAKYLKELAGSKNIDLTQYLIKESLQTHKERVSALRNFYPDVKDADWQLAKAGQRVMIIKKDEKGKGKLEFGTEMVAAKDGSLAVLLGASPGASTAVQAMIEVVERCMGDKISTTVGNAKMLEMFPSYGQSLKDEEILLNTIKTQNLATLNLS